MVYGILSQNQQEERGRDGREGKEKSRLSHLMHPCLPTNSTEKAGGVFSSLVEHLPITHEFFGSNLSTKEKDP